MISARSRRLLLGDYLENPANYTSDKPYMPILVTSSIAGSIMVAAPNMLGCLARIPACMMLEAHSSRVLHFSVSVISLAGIVGLTVLSFLVQNKGELGGGFYALYVFCGCIGGVGRGSSAIT